ncbi:MAG: radical SAM protein [bacterium]|nr:radical SAM protein [bacterium]
MKKSEHNPMKRKYPLRLVFWETTVGCNLRCVHCRAEATPASPPEDLTTKQALKFIDDLVSFASPILILSGGEPLFRRDIFELANYATEKGLRVALATNGTLVTKEVAHRILQSGIKRVSISLDGATDKTHDTFRGSPGSFELAITGLKNLKELQMSLQLNVTVTKHNVTELSKLMELAQKFEIDAVHLFMLVPTGCGLIITAEQQLLPEEYEQILNWLYDQSKVVPFELRATCAPHYYRILRQRAKKDRINVTRYDFGFSAMTRGCLAGTGVCFISYRGDVYPCGYLPVKAGNINEQTIQNIWEQSDVLQILRDPTKLRGKCSICEYQTICYGCRARAYGETGNYLNEEPYCIYEPKYGSPTLL